MPTTQDIASLLGGTITQDYNPPNEFGVDVGLPVGTPVRQVAGGTYQRQLSSGYTNVFQLPGGGYENYVHITPVPFAQGQSVPAGTVVGYVSPIYNPAPPYSVGTFPNDVTGQAIGPFSSSGPHVEVGYYGDPTQAENAYGNSSMNPAGLLSLSSPAPSVPGSTAPVQSGQQPFPEDPLQQWLTDHVPGLGWLTGTTPSAGSPTGSNPPILGNAAPGNSGSPIPPITPATPLLGGLGNVAGTVANAAQNGADAAAGSAAQGLLSGARSLIPQDAGTRLAVILVGVVLLLIAGTLLSHGKILTVAGKAAAA